MLYATSDLHGYPLDDFLRLLDKVGFSDADRLYILGDVIDRNGDGGVQTLEWMLRRPNVSFILGNHEDMMLSCAPLFDPRGNGDVRSASPRQKMLLRQWLLNGAEPTILSLLQLSRVRPEAVIDIIDGLRAAPLCDAVSTDAGEFLLVHAGLGNFAPDKPMADYTTSDLVWYRPEADERFYAHITTVFGHTPTDWYGTPGRMFVTPTWIDIDVGGAMGRPPMLLRLDDLQPIYAEADAQ